MASAESELLELLDEVALLEDVELLDALALAEPELLDALSVDCSDSSKVCRSLLSLENTSLRADCDVELSGEGASGAEMNGLLELADEVELELADEASCEGLSSSCCKACHEENAGELLPTVASDIPDLPM